jgi:hypothetical protein
VIRENVKNEKIEMIFKQIGMKSIFVVPSYWNYNEKLLFYPNNKFELKLFLKNNSIHRCIIFIYKKKVKKN